MKQYKSTGLVYGQFWGGGEGSYPASILVAKTRKALLLQAKAGLNGTLDSGMGFECLLGARLVIEEVETVTVKGLQYCRSEVEVVYIGKLTDAQVDHLEECTTY